MVDEVEKAALPPGQAPDPFSKPIDENSNIVGQIMTTPGPQPTWDPSKNGGGPDLSVNSLTFKEIGNSGLRMFAGWVKEDPLLELQGRQGAQKYREMGDNSPVIGAILYAIQSTMRKVEWRVVANEDQETGPAQENADFLESCMHDMSEPWENLVVENISSLQYGYAVHEIIYKRRMGRNPKPIPNPNNPYKPYQPAGSDYDDGKIGWRRMPIRGQDTILSWFTDATGQVTGVRQLPWTGIFRDIPIEKMLLFRPIVHKQNPEGRSILRTAWSPYYYCKRMQEQEAILGERMGGIPVVKVPEAMIEAANNGNSKAIASMNSFKNLAVNLRIDEQMGVVMPSDTYAGANGPSTAPRFSLELITPQGGGRGGTLNFEAAIQRYSIQMMTSVLADFLTLGHEARGSQSLAVTKVDLFFQAVEGFLNINAAIYNKYAIPRLFALNGMPTDQLPTIEPDLAQRVDLDVLSNFVLRLAQAGMPLFPDDELQTFLRDAAGMPDVTDDGALQAAGLLDSQLDLNDEKAQASLDAMTNPQAQPVKPAGGGGFGKRSNLEKILLASLARRMIRHAGPRFGVNTKRHKHNGATRHG